VSELRQVSATAGEAQVSRYWGTTTRWRNGWTCLQLVCWQHGIWPQISTYAGRHNRTGRGRGYFTCDHNEV